VPVVVAVLGIVGIISGQLVNAWREDRRWRRELEREDLRWQRERERDHERQEIERSREDLRHAQDARIEWRLQRFETYKQFLAAADACEPERAIGVRLLDLDGNERDGSRSDIEAQDRQSPHLEVLVQALVAVQFIGGDSVVRAAETLSSWAHRHHRLLAPSWLSEKDPDEERKERQARLKIVRLEFPAVREAFVREVKLELALEVPKAEATIPARPSDPTS
jgi:hypothetical protein